MKKETVESNDIPGFIVNRMLAPYINEAIYALYEGVSTKEQIDLGMKLGTNGISHYLYTDKLHFCCSPYGSFNSG